MIKTIVTMVVTAIAGLVGYLVSDSFRERLAQKQRDKIASEVARGDEAAVNARIGRFRSFVPWVVAALLVIGGCAVTRTVYVKEQDRVTALRPGEVYSNATDAVEWVVPRTVMTGVGWRCRCRKEYPCSRKSLSGANRCSRRTT